MGSLQIAFRVWQVYWVHIGVFVVTLFLMLVLNATQIFPRNEVGALNLTPFLNNTGPNLIRARALFFTIFCPTTSTSCRDVYLKVEFLVLIPVMMALARVDVRLAFVFSAVLWIAASMGLNLPAELWFSNGSERTWFFNPFAWQLVFFTGFALMAGWLPPPPVHRWLVVLAIVVVVISVPFAWGKIIAASEFVRDWRREWSFLFNKSGFFSASYAHTSISWRWPIWPWAAAGEGRAPDPGRHRGPHHRGGLAGWASNRCGGLCGLDGDGAGSGGLSEPCGRRGAWRPWS